MDGDVHRVLTRGAISVYSCDSKNAAIVAVLEGDIFSAGCMCLKQVYPIT